MANFAGGLKYFAGRRIFSSSKGNQEPNSHLKTRPCRTHQQPKPNQTSLSVTVIAIECNANQMEWISLS